jgi:hypothetical protein
MNILRNEINLHTYFVFCEIDKSTFATSMIVVITVEYVGRRSGAPNMNWHDAWRFNKAVKDALILISITHTLR